MKSSASSKKKSSAKGHKKRPQKKKKALNAVTNSGKYTVKQKSKGGKSKKGKASTDTGASATQTDPVKVVIPIIDPWKSLKSPYGGRASPADEFNKLLSWNQWSKVDVTACSKSGNISTRILQSGMLFQFWKETEKLFYQSQLQKSSNEDSIPSVDGNKVESSEDQAATLTAEETVDTVQAGSVNSKYVVIESSGEKSSTNINLEEAEARKHRVACVSMDISELSLGPDMQNQLVGLDLTDNRFTYHSVGGLNALYLRELIIVGNQISKFPDLSHLPLLLVLDLSYNPIKTLTDDTKKTFSICKNLRIVRLEGCELEDDDGSGGTKISLFDYFSLLANVMEELNIGNNRLTHRDNLESLKSCKRIKSLVVRGNPCTMKVTGDLLTPDKGDIDTEWCLKLAMKFGALKMYNNCKYSHSIKSFNSNDFSLSSGGELGATTGAGDDGANCSCVEGNPCVVPYNCKNWSKRFEISRRARENKEVQM